MDPFSMTLGTQVKVFSLEDDGTTVVVTSTDTALPHQSPAVAYEVCESDAEAAAVVQKFVFDLERQGWS